MKDKKTKKPIVITHFQGFQDDDEGQSKSKKKWLILTIFSIAVIFVASGAFFIFKGERYKILKAEIGNSLGKIGEVINDKLEISCGNNQSIKILEIQRQGKKPQKINEFILGSQIKKGSVIENV